MKKINFLAFPAFLFISVFANGQQKEVSSEIVDVTVFYQGAQVSRITSELSLPKDQTVLVVKGLEQSLQENSLRVGVKGSARILNVVKSIDYLDQKSSSAKIEELNVRQESNKDKIEDLRLKIKVYEQEKNMLLANMKLGGANNGVSVAQIKEGAAYYRIRLTEIETTILETNRLIRQTEEENRKIQAQLNELNYKKNIPTSRLEVTVEMDNPGNCGLLLDYIVPEAGWKPSYDIRIDEVGDPVKIIRKATLVQKTGEEWKNISLTFSTGNPMEQQRLPVLPPWYLSFIYPNQGAISIRGVAAPKASSMKQKQENVAYAALDEASVEDDYDLYSSIAATRSSNNNSILEFNMPTKASISADGKEYAFSLGTEELKAAYHYQAVPKKDKAAYLVATMTDWEGYELVDGVANIYYERMFIGETFLSTTMTLDSMQLSMGKDKGIIIDRKTVKDFTKTRSIGSNIRKNFGYEIIVRNTKSTEVELIIEDQIPISSDSEITVDSEDLGGGELDKNSGKVTWRITLKPGETSRLPLKYSVRYPKGRTINL